MRTTPVFKGLTREVTIGGLPQMYFVIYIMLVMIPFILFQSFVFSIAFGAIGYPLLRMMVSYDPKAISVFITATQSTALKLSALSEKGFTYRA